MRKPGNFGMRKGDRMVMPIGGWINANMHSGTKSSLRSCLAGFGASIAVFGTTSHAANHEGSISYGASHVLSA